MEIFPFISVGILSFGDSRQIARTKLASTYSIFRKGKEINETDSFDSLGLHLYYDNSDCLEFIETFGPAELTFRGIKFIGMELETVTTELKSLGLNPTESDVGVIFDEVGIALTAPSGIVEGVAAYQKGYYDE